MPQFDVYQPHSGGVLLLDCQSNVLNYLNTRFAVPLMPLSRAPTPAGRLNPIFQVEGDRFSMVTQFAATVPAGELGDQIASLERHHIEIIRALDVLVGGV